MIRIIFTTIALTSLAAADTEIFQTFEGDGFDGWVVEGSAFGAAPVAGKTEAMAQPFIRYSNDSLVASNHGGVASIGSLTSPEFTVKEDFISFLIAGGDYIGKTAIQLVIDGEVVREAVGKRDLLCERATWFINEFKGKKAKLRLIDNETGEWGFIGIDHIMFSDNVDYHFPSTTRAGQLFIEGLVKTDVVAGISIPIGSTLKLEATHEAGQITSPTAITFDDQGRIYVAETHRNGRGVEDDRNHTYLYLDDLASKKVSDRRALHEKWKDKLPIEKMTEFSEVIKRLADTDGDGKIDQTKVFADKFNDVLDGTAAGVFFYEGSLYFSCIPNLMMLRDTNNDGTADERKVLEEGFGVRISLSGHDLNGFALGPDGRIYGTIGDRGYSLTTKAGVTYDYPNEGAAFRFEPDGSGFEIFHTGLRNPKEIAFDALGNAFTVDNNSDQGDKARIVYLVEGGESGWQMENQTMHTFHREIGLENRPPNRWMDEKMWELENSAQPAYMLPPSAHLSSGPSGLTSNPGAGFLEKEAGHFLICDYRGAAANSGIWSFKMDQIGAGMKMTDSRQFAWGVAATDVEYSWDGRVFISDFVTGWKSHAAGRLFSLSASESMWNSAEVASAVKIMKEGFEQRSSAELANLLKHPDSRIRLRAQVALTRKSDALQRFVDAADSSIFMVRVHGIQGLGILSRRGSSPLPVAKFGDIPSAKTRTEAEEKLIALLQDKNAEIRAQSLRALADSKNESNSIQLAPLLADESMRVRFFAAILAGKRQMVEYYGPICDLLVENNNRDVYLRHACIYALQGMAIENPNLLVGLNSHESPTVRLAAVVALRRMKNPSVTSFIRDEDTKVADEAIRAVYDTDIVGPSPNVAELLDDVHQREWAPFMLRRLVHAAFRNGTEMDAQRLVKVALDSKFPDPLRNEALRLLTTWTEPFPADQVTGHWRPLEKRDAKTIRPALLAALPELLKQENFVLTAALGWIERYQLASPTLKADGLKSLVKNTKLPAQARSIALNLFIATKPEKLGDFLTEIMEDPSDEVSLTALAAIAKLSPESAIQALQVAVNSKNINRAQRTWGILATMSGDFVDAIFIEKLNELSSNKGVSPSAIELLNAAKQRTSSSVLAAVEAFEKSLTVSSDPLAKWSISLEGGDASNGGELFKSHPASECMRCHRAEEGHTVGGETAPNLAGIANRHQDRRYFLESIIQPSSTISPGFGAVLIDFKNGTNLSGNLIAETAEHVDLNVTGKNWRIRRSDIASLTPPISPMPPMGEALNPSQLRDIIAWLASLKQGGEKQAAAVATELFDPATLVAAAPTTAPHNIDPALMKIGQQQYVLCSACHGQNGEGTVVGPPLAGSEWVNGPEENLIRIQLRGLKGPIKVKNKEYNFPAGMMAQAYQTDDQIAAVLSYVRNSFGNSAPPVKTSSVSTLRSEVGKPQLTTSDLVSPTATK